LLWPWALGVKGNMGYGLQIVSIFQLGLMENLISKMKKDAFKLLKAHGAF